MVRILKSFEYKAINDACVAWLGLRLSPMAQQRTGIPNNAPNWGLRNGTYYGEFRMSELDYEEDFLMDRIQIAVLGASSIPPPTNFELKFNTCTLDPKQDLVVLVEDEQEGSGFAHFHFRSLTTGHPHPLAEHPVLTVRLDKAFLRNNNLLDQPMSTDREIMESYFLAKIHWPESDYKISEILVWEWKTGALLSRIYHEHTSARFVFIDKSHLLIYSILPEDTHHSARIALFVYRIPSITTNSGPVPGEVVYTKSAMLCCSHVITLGLEFRIYSHPNLRSCAYEPPEGNKKTVDFRVFVDTHSLFFHILPHSTEDTTIIPWTDWGTDATRWFIEDRSMEHLMLDLYRSQYTRYTTIKSTETQLLSIVDFNSPVIKLHNSGASSRPKRASADKVEKNAILDGRGLTAGRPFQTRISSAKLPIPTVGKTLNHQTFTEMITSEIKTIVRVGFKDPVESCLPYRVVTKVQRMPRHVHWQIHGEYLVGISRRDWNAAERPPLSLYKLELPLPS
ncbi:unnamed protein product [Rhizoctonia solani]|uniref:Uncharacterized protein n=1 Tax=Rhizoctonia solani TaxID=456999 RepID=A0A8H3APB0_9AGAM|nr:unnamed protein product [Rhizoctonia solani]